MSTNSIVLLAMIIIDILKMMNFQVTIIGKFLVNELFVDIITPTIY